MARILEANRHEKFDKAILTEMGELGLLGPTIKVCPVREEEEVSTSVVVWVKAPTSTTHKRRRRRRRREKREISGC